MRTDLASVGAYSIFAHLLRRRGRLDRAAAAVERANILLPRLTPAFCWLMVETRPGRPGRRQQLGRPALSALRRNFGR
jgi:hypothetical protein